MTHACKEVIPIEKLEAEDKSGNVRNDGGKILNTFSYFQENEDNDESETPEYKSVICKKCKLETIILQTLDELDEPEIGRTIECKKCRTTLNVPHNNF